MRRTVLAAFLAVLALTPLVALAGPVHAAGLAGAAEPAASYSPVQANLTGPHVLAQRGTGDYTLRATGGPAFLPNGTMVGNLSYTATVSGSNTTGVSLSPPSSDLVNGTGALTLATSNLTQALTISVEITSTYETTNATLNITFSVTVVQPYIVSATLVSGANTSIAGFTIQVDLDGALVGNITVPEMLANETHQVSYAYATLGLASGWHTFTLSIAGTPGLVRFSNGEVSYSVSFYVPGSTPSYTLWYAVGIVAFLGTTFILVTRLAARRRGTTRR
jgi:hypothetical protein